MGNADEMRRYLVTVEVNLNMKGMIGGTNSEDVLAVKAGVIIAEIVRRGLDKSEELVRWRVKGETHLQPRRNATVT